MVAFLDVAHPQRPFIMQGAGLGIAALPLGGFAAPVPAAHLSPPAPRSHPTPAPAPAPSSPVEPPAEVAGPAPPVAAVALAMAVEPHVGPPLNLAGAVVPRTFGQARRIYDKQGADSLPALLAYLDTRPEPADFGRTHYLIGLIRLTEGRGRAARAAFDVAAPHLAAIADDIEYHRAESAFVAGDLFGARKAFWKFLARHADSQWAPRVRFRLADIDFAMGEHGRARTQYQELLGRYPEYPGIAMTQFNIARCQEALGNRRTAAADYRDLTIAMRDPDVARRAEAALKRLSVDEVEPPPLTYAERLSWAKSLSYWKRWEASEALFAPLLDDLRTKRSGDDRLAEAHYWRGRNLFAWERYENALLELRAAQDAGIGSRVHSWLARTYERLGQPTEAATVYARFKHGADLDDKLQDMYFDEARYDLARAHLLRLFEQRPWLTRKFHYKWRLTWLNLRQGRLEEAAKGFEELSAGKGRSRWQARYWWGRTLERLGRPDEARQQYRSITERITTSYYALQADNRLRDLDHPPTPGPARRPVAEYLGQGLPLAAPPSAPAPWARRPRRRPTLAHGSRRLVDGLADAEVRPPPPSLPHGLSRGGAKVEWDDDAGEEAAASHAADDDGAEDPPGAEVALVGGSVEPLPEEAELSVSAYSPSDSADVVFNRLVRKYGDLFPQLRRAREMAQFGRWWDVRRDLESALHEVREVRRNGSGKLARLTSALGGSFIDHREHKKGLWGSDLVYSLAPASVTAVSGKRRRQLSRLRGGFYRDLGAGFAYSGAYHYAKKYLLLSGEHNRVRPDGSPKDRALWARAYPRAYEELVLRYSIENGVPPYLMWAVMTVESSHYPAAVSRANARGLMQVIPKTGYLVGRLMGLEGWSAAKLVEPEVAIRFGCWYMAQLLEKFRGQEPLAIAAYNGGPHNVAYWLKRKGDLPLDEFVEEMRFTQARGYTKKVLKFVRLYRRIYTDSKELYVSNDLNPAFKDNINF